MSYVCESILIYVYYTVYIYTYYIDQFGRDPVVEFLGTSHDLSLRTLW